MTAHRIVTQQEWLDASKALLAKEKEFTQAREELARERRALPWVRIEKAYAFDSAEGRVTLGDLFAGHGQLVVQHFMFGADWNEGCPSCSFWSDNFNGIDKHLAARDTAFVVVSRGPLDKLNAYRKRMGWTFRWVSSAPCDFNQDFAVSFEADEQGPAYNFGTIKPPGREMPGVSAFRKGEDGSVYRTYSTYSRGIDMLNGTYQLLDITSKGRDEAELRSPMAWVRRHDKY